MTCRLKEATMDSTGGSARTGRRRLSRLVGLTAGAGALGLLLSDSAGEEDYLVVQCHSQHSFGAVFATFSSNGQRPQASNNCGSSGGIGVFEAGAPAADGVWGQWAWTAP